MEFSSDRRITLANVRDAIPNRDGKLYAELFRQGALAVEITRPRTGHFSSL